jgi:hypothetical protein
MIDEVCCSVQEGGIVVENGAPALSRTPVWLLAGAPACLGHGQWVMQLDKAQEPRHAR